MTGEHVYNLPLMIQQPFLREKKEPIKVDISVKLVPRSKKKDRKRKNDVNIQEPTEDENKMCENTVSMEITNGDINILKTEISKENNIQIEEADKHAETLSEITKQSNSATVFNINDNETSDNKVDNKEIEIELSIKQNISEENIDEKNESSNIVDTVISSTENNENIRNSNENIGEEINKINSAETKTTDRIDENELLDKNCSTLKSEENNVEVEDTTDEIEEQSIIETESVEQNN